MVSKSHLYDILSVTTESDAENDTRHVLTP